MMGRRRFLAIPLSAIAVCASFAHADKIYWTHFRVGNHWIERSGILVEITGEDVVSWRKERGRWLGAKSISSSHQEEWQEQERKEPCSS